MTEAVELPGNPWDPFDPAKLSPSHGPLALRALRYLSAYTRLQDNAGWYLRGWLDTRPDSAAADGLTLTELARLSDERMVVLVRAAAVDLNSSADLGAFKGTFSKVKAVRDHIAHAMFFNLMESGSKPSLGIPYYQGNARVRKLEGQESSVSDRILANRERELLWLFEVVEWLAQECGYWMGPGTLNRTMEIPRARP